MGEKLMLKAQDGHELSAYVSRPEGPAKGAVVVVQEIFGVNFHIRDIADGFAKQGYLAIAPALFDRFERDVELGYTGDDAKRAFAEFYPKLAPETALLDVAAAFHEAVREHEDVAILGFCYGGLMAWLAATRGDTVKMRPACCIGYYAGGVGNFAKEEPTCPVMLHFGGADAHIGPEQIDAVRTAHPEVEVFVYEGAGHAFNRSPDPNSYHAEAAKLAGERTDAFLATHLA